jgi:GNAT superfamily N-acetyltransferase
MSTAAFSFAGLYSGRARRDADTDSAELELADGRHVLVQPVRAGDSHAERAFIAGLSPSSRYLRFHFGLKELTPEAAVAMTALDPALSSAFVAHAEDGTIVADARHVRHADSASAEFALVVADAWQSAGLGRALLVRLADHARRQGLVQLVGDVLWGNLAMVTLVRALGGTLARVPGDATVLRACLDLRATATRDPSRTGGAADLRGA